MFFILAIGYHKFDFFLKSDLEKKPAISIVGFYPFVGG